MSVAQNIGYPLARRGVGKPELRRRVGEIMDLVELGHLGARRPSELSGGQQQRVALARALVFRPRALLLDEPLAALDRQLRESLQDELRRLHRDLGVTIVLVTHDQQEALHLSDRIAVFNRGAIEQLGSPRELYERPATPFVARFLGESTFLEGRMSGGAVELGGDRIPVSAGGVADGQAVALVVRPEAVAITAGGARPEREVVREATVTDLVYRGTSVRATTRLDGGAEVLASFGARDLGGLRIGDRVAVGWNLADGSVVASDRGAASIPTTGAAV
jgi:putative spermidine/putrescine transport system ATP-binding protein